MHFYSAWPGGRSRLYFLLSVRCPTMQYIVIYIAIVVFGSAYSEYTSAPPKIPKFCGRTAPMLILISQLQKCPKNLPILITNYILFENAPLVILSSEPLPSYQELLYHGTLPSYHGYYIVYPGGMRWELYSSTSDFRSQIRWLNSNVTAGRPWTQPVWVHVVAGPHDRFYSFKRHANVEPCKFLISLAASSIFEN